MNNPLEGHTANGSAPSFADNVTITIDEKQMGGREGRRGRMPRCAESSQVI